MLITEALWSVFKFSFKKCVASLRMNQKPITVKQHKKPYSIEAVQLRFKTCHYK